MCYTCTFITVFIFNNANAFAAQLTTQRSPPPLAGWLTMADRLSLYIYFLL